MGFAILRTQKLKSGHAVRRSMTHAFREQDTPNADAELTPQNTHMGAENSNEALDRFNARLATQDKIRSNAVLAVEYLITGSPEVMQAKTREQQDAYFRDALEWLEKRHGKENVVYAGIHRDESTPHMYAYVVPIDDKGKLNCRAFLGGAKALSTMQTDFAQTVGQRHELQRGIQGSRARHQTVKSYYGAISREPRHVSITAEVIQPRVLKKAGILDKLKGQGDLIETPEMVASRLTKGVNTFYEPACKAAAGAIQEHKQAKQVRNTAAMLEKRSKPLLDALNRLKPELQTKLMDALKEASARLLEVQSEQKKTRNRDRGGFSR